jgi:hypothetical protein
MCTVLMKGKIPDFPVLIFIYLKRNWSQKDFRLAFESLYRPVSGVNSILDRPNLILVA